MGRSSGPFEILEVLGDGAFGAVFVARRTDDPLRRLVAIKVLKKEYVSNPKVLHRTRDEARLLSKLHHPNIVRVEQLTEVSGRPVLVMELVQGVSLKRLIQREPDGIPVSVALECMRQTCLALHAAYNHAIGDDGRPMRVIHRDIKPSNMLLSIHGALKVVDFGIATGQFQDREAQTESVVMGSRPYMAPERLDGAHDTPAVDIYSAGMSLLELLIGRTMNLSINPTHHDRTLGQCLVELAPDGLSSAGREELRSLIRRMCAYDALQRPTAQEAVSDIQRILDGMDPAWRVSLEQYAHDVVERLFWRRRQVPLHEAIQGLEDAEIITGVFGGIVVDDVPRKRNLGRKPAAFLGFMFGTVLALSYYAWEKASSLKTESPSGPLVSFKVWIPSDARARVDSYAIIVPGSLEATPGPNELEITLDDGVVYTCPILVRAGMSARYVAQLGSAAVSIDDCPAVPCARGSEAPAEAPREVPREALREPPR